MSAPSPARWIYKILRPAEDAALRAAGRSLGAPIDLADGYVHLSAADQVQETLARHFAAAGPLLLLKIDPEALPAGALRWEPSRGGALFPHLYAPLPLSAVAETTALQPDAAGAHLLLAPLADARA
jgi:uncharacterized protein (DUF952 family)